MTTAAQSTIGRRAPATVMRLARLGAAHQCRLSFMRVLVRRLQRDAWRVERALFAIDAKGCGTAVYTARGPERVYSLVAFGHDVAGAERTDLVTAAAWDATFALVDGQPDTADLERLRANVPRQERGRLSVRELCLARANRSERLFDHVVERLAQGLQPEASAIDEAGYVMRTTAVYGSGKFGCCDREMLQERSEFAEPFQVEMLSIYLIRAFSLDLVEHLARLASPETAVAIAPLLKRRIGVGNATGLGMAPFLINHPILINNWIAAREEALMRVRRVARPSAQERALFRHRLGQALAMASSWRSNHPLQAPRLIALRGDLARIQAWFDASPADVPYLWDTLHRRAEAALSLEGQEQLVSLLLEPHGALVDPLACRMNADEGEARRVDGTMRVAALRALLETVYDWALALDFNRPEARARLWYVSAETREPGLGPRALVDETYEQPLAPGFDAKALHLALADWPGDARVAAFVLRHPQHRRAVRRAQLAQRFPYAEIRDNTLGADLVPLDLLRAKLAFFGATRFDPVSDRWVRITMYQGAPLPEELATGDVDGWVFEAA